jgi:meso-butanediol dehydrogenase / (S,S)-butanediol dehydrogenase / diacetyl reductase
MAGRFVGKTVIVTGAARGLGLGVAQRFSNEGADVWLVDIDELVLGSAAEIGEQAVVLDVSEPGAIDATVETVVVEHGRLDVMVANAGIGGGAPIADLSDELYRRIMAVNLDGVFFSCRAAARAMRLEKSGVIVTTGSVFGRDTPAGSGAYGAAKAGVMAMTHALARELAGSGVRVNCVSPGHMGTELYWNALQRRAIASGRGYKEMVAAELAQVPMGRFGTGEDVAGLVAFLASDDAAYLTGQTINIDGGLQPI